MGSYVHNYINFFAQFSSNQSDNDTSALNVSQVGYS